MDETGCHDAATKTVKFIVEKATKLTHTRFSLALAVNVAERGNPFTVFSEENMQRSFPGTVGGANESGKMDSKTFHKYTWLILLGTPMLRKVRRP